MRQFFSSRTLFLSWILWEKGGESGKRPLLHREPEGWWLEGLGMAANIAARGELGC